MERRKLFGKVEDKTRKKLFSNSRRKLFNDNVNIGTSEASDGADAARVVPEPEDIQYKDVKCMDCGYVYPYEGSALNLVCPNCGSDRFELVQNITSEDEIKSNIPTVDEEGNPIDKAFSDKRRKLFNDNPLPENPSGSVTSSNPGPTELPKSYTCPDCGAVFESKEQYVDGITCPICGGSRCRLSDTVNDEFSTKKGNIMIPDYETDELDEILSKYKGRSVNIDTVESDLHEKGIYDKVGGAKGLVDSGYAIENGDELMFSDISDLQRKMFSKLVISVTKEFDIDPVTDRESLINSLSERLPDKSIMILRKSQGIPEAVNFSDKSYLKDSGISDDLKVGYGGSTINLKDFMKILSEEYPDAPDDIIDLLEGDKTIKVNGGKVLISK